MEEHENEQEQTKPPVEIVLPFNKVLTSAPYYIW